MSFDGIVIKKKVFLGYSQRSLGHVDVVVEVIEVQSSATFELCLGEEFIEFW